MEPQPARPSPWHAGEIALQRRVGVAERMADHGRRVIRDHLIPQHREFYPLLSFVVLGAVEPEGDVWATLRAGPEGFLGSRSPHSLAVAVPRDPHDPAERGMEDGAAVGLLGIDLQTRRRNRINGTIHRNGPDGFEIGVEQSYGNCNQYIRQREFAFTRDPATPAPALAEEQTALDADARTLIAAADTFFVASYVRSEDGGRQVDVSHRGGKPGFVRLGTDGVLTIPDFAGNLFFNTLGNFLENPKAGLVFPDFATGGLLQLSGTAEVVLDSPEIAAFQGAERLWRFTPHRVLHRPAALPIRWREAPDGQSPNALMTGDWDQAAARSAAAALAKSWRPFRVAQIVDESSLIRSFHLEPADGAGIVPHLAGQHLPIRVTLPGSDRPVIRTYTLSVAPSDGHYRISVKRESRVSRHLHEAVKAGDLIEAQLPAGGFTIDASATRPAVLLAAGIGITPMLAMLRHLVYEGLRKRRVRPSWLFYAARSKPERAFDGELADLVAAAKGAAHVVRVLSDVEGAAEGVDYEATGRIDMALLIRTLPFNDYDFYLCGPPGFMQAVYDGLRGLNIADARIHAEAFGPASLNRLADLGAPMVPVVPPATESVRVLFAQSGKEARWTPETGSLLDLAESRGLAPDFSCREGSCGTCRTRVLAGRVSYPRPPTAAIGADEALICCAVPGAPADGEPDEALQLDL